MADVTPIQGELQTQIMTVLWRVGEGTVEEVRSALPSRYRGAYTTVQTVLNRLTDRGMLSRKREGKTFVYQPKVSEADYVSRSIERALAGASTNARQNALAALIGGIDRGELSDLRKLAREIEKGKAKRR